jgi:hypothetical protein
MYWRQNFFLFYMMFVCAKLPIFWKVFCIRLSLLFCGFSLVLSITFGDFYFYIAQIRTRKFGCNSNAFKITSGDLLEMSQLVISFTLFYINLSQIINCRLILENQRTILKLYTQFSPLVIFRPYVTITLSH